jgi:superfamily II DNA or RNA helicase
VSATTQDQFVASLAAKDGARIQRQRQASGFLGRQRQVVVPVSAWPDEDGAVAFLREQVARGAATEAGDGIMLPHGVVAALDAEMARRLGLPEAAPLLLHVRAQGLIVDDGFALVTRWTRGDGQPVAAQVDGALVRMGGQEFRLPEPLFGLFAAAQAVNAAGNASGKQAAYAAWRGKLAEAGLEQAGVTLDAALADIRIAHASAFSLKIDGDQFDPVLFAPRIVESAVEGAEIDEAGDNLLTPDDQQAFAAAFRQAAGRRRSYLLRGGLLLFLDAGLADALSVVGEKQRAPAAERKRFAVTPRAVIAEAVAGSDPEALFIETTQYSQRITGLDIWKQPVLPWIKPKPESWLPESFGLAVGDEAKQIDVPPQDAAMLLARVEAAIAAGEASIDYSGHCLPASPATREALAGLVAIAKAAAVNADDPARPPPAALQDRYFLQTLPNLESLTYAPLIAPPEALAPPPQLPAGLATTLKPHQRTGFDWLVSAWRQRRPGVLLADDMGLGKTLQVLAFFCWLREQGVSDPLLVVAPTGLLDNWAAEIRRHLAPGALGTVERAQGTALAAIRDGRQTDIATGRAGIDVQRWQQAGVVLTTYETMRDYHLSLARIGFAAIAFDEAQKLKNPAAQVTRAAETLRARLEIAMTGTPVENRLHDVWSISDVVHPGWLGTSKDFEARYGNADADGLRALGTQLTGGAAEQPAFMLRRMKSDHVEGLPRKTVKLEAQTMPPAQAQAYGIAVQRALGARAARADRGQVLETLGRLRSLSLVPALPVPGPDFARDSARLLATFRILDEISARGEKVLIFCEALALQPLLATELRRLYRLERPVACISGEVPGEARQRIVDAFQAAPPGFDALILSPRAGGVGLTITAANHVIHLSRWWNPAVEDQATDRVYRIGQDRDVTVWLPIARHPTLGDFSFDVKLDGLLSRKRQLAQGLLIAPEAENDAFELLDDVLANANEVNNDPDPVRVTSLPLALIEKPVEPIPDHFLPLRRLKKLGDAPPMRLFVDPLQYFGPVRLDIVDPYAAGSLQSCEVLADFLTVLKSERVNLSRVCLECYDAESLEHGFASNGLQSSSLARLLRERSLDDIRFFPEFRSRRKGARLHDRRIVARNEDGGRLVWDLGRGIDGLMLRHRDCTINRTYYPPGVAIDGIE